MTDTVKEFGGNAVRAIEATQPGRHLFAEVRYTYYLLVTQGQREIRVPDLLSFSVFLLSRATEARVIIAESGQELQVGDAVQVESATLTLAVNGPAARLLVAGTCQASGRDAGVTVTPAPGIYKVAKPWGHELWINGQHPNYALKEISIRAGNKTSLQYHRQKQETNVLFHGAARLHFKNDSRVPNDEVGTGNLGFVDVQAVSAIDVVPLVIHRLEALTDVLLYEVSTPHLDDVVRIQDDAGRPDGRIANEHRG